MMNHTRMCNQLLDLTASKYNSQFFFTEDCMPSTYFKSCECSTYLLYLFPLDAHLVNQFQVFLIQDPFNVTLGNTQTCKSGDRTRVNLSFNSSWFLKLCFKALLHTIYMMTAKTKLSLWIIHFCVLLKFTNNLHLWINCLSQIFNVSYIISFFSSSISAPYLILWLF